MGAAALSVNLLLTMSVQPTDRSTRSRSRTRSVGSVATAEDAAAAPLEAKVSSTSMSSVTRGDVEAAPLTEPLSSTHSLATNLQALSMSTAVPETQSGSGDRAYSARFDTKEPVQEAQAQLDYETAGSPTAVTPISSTFTSTSTRTTQEVRPSCGAPRELFIRMGFLLGNPCPQCKCPVYEHAAQTVPTSSTSTRPEESPSSPSTHKSGSVVNVSPHPLEDNHHLALAPPPLVAVHSMAVPPSATAHLNPQTPLSQVTVPLAGATSAPLTSTSVPTNNVRAVSATKQDIEQYVQRVKSQPTSTLSSSESEEHVPWSKWTAENEAAHRDKQLRKKAGTRRHAKAHHEEDPEFSSGDDPDEMEIISHRRVKPTDLFRNPKASDVMKMIEGVELWSPEQEPFVHPRRFLTLMEFRLRLVTPGDEEKFPSRTWQMPYLALRMKRETDANWIRTNMVPKALSWEKAREAFNEHFKTPQGEFQVQQEYQNLQQGKDTFNVFSDKFTHLLTQKGFDLNAPDRNKDTEIYFIEDLVRKLNRDLAKEWIKHPVWGPQGKEYVPTLAYCIAHLQKLEAQNAAAASFGNGRGPAPESKQAPPRSKGFYGGMQSWCTFHNSSSHNTKDCNAAKRHAASSSNTEGKTKEGSNSHGAGGPPTQYGQGRKVHFQTKLDHHFLPADSATRWSSSSSYKPPEGRKVCSECSKPGHTAAECWTAHPELRPNKGSASGTYPGNKGIRPAVVAHELSQQDMDDILHDSKDLLKDDEPGYDVGQVFFPRIAALKIAESPHGWAAFTKSNPLPPLPQETKQVSIEVVVEVVGNRNRDPQVASVAASSDSGCSLSAIGMDVVKSLELPIIPHDANNPHKALVLADGRSVPRIGRTPPLNLTLYFRDETGQQEPFSPLTITASLEVVQSNFPAEEGNRIIYGQDLMYQLYAKYIDDMPVDHLKRFTVHVMGPRYQDVAKAPTAAAISHAQASKPGAEVEEEHIEREEDMIPPSAYLDLDKDLEVEPTLEIDAKDEKVRAKDAAAALELPAVQDAIRRNAAIPKSSFCHHPDALVTMKLKKDADLRKLYRKQFPVSRHDEPFVDKQVEAWNTNGVIRRMNRSTTANTPLFPVPKMEGGIPNPDKRRITLAIDHINGQLDADQDRFPIPSCSVNHQFLAGKNYYGEIDIEDCFTQFPLAEEAQSLTAFTWKGIQYEFLRAPFGLSFLPSFVHRFVSNQVQRFPWAKPFIDNVQWGSDTWEEHAAHLVQLLNLFTSLNIRIKIAGIKLGYTRIRVLGHILSSKGLTADPRKLEMLRDWPEPPTGKAMERFLGVVGYLRGYVRHYGEISAPLEAVKKHKKIEWTPVLSECFATLKRAILSSPSLVFPDFTRKFFIATDASCLGVGGVLYQSSPTGEDPEEIYSDNIVAIVSKVLSGPMLHYSTYKRELLAIVVCLRKLHYYLWGRMDTTIFTDHKPLLWLFNDPEPAISIQGFMDVICSYTFRVKHIPGCKNILPDYLSRVYSREYKTEWGVRRVKLPFTLEDGESRTEEGPPPYKSGAPPRLAPLVPAGEQKADVGANSVVPIPSEALEAERRGKTLPSPEERESLIHKFHSYGHVGRDRVIAKILDSGYWWSGLKDHVHRIIMKCDPCARTVIVRQGFKPAQFITSDGPWKHLQIDCMHMPTSAEGYTAVLCIIDVFSGFQLLFAILTTSSLCVAEKLWYAFSIFGLPEILQSDNGPEFLNKTIKAIKELLDFDHRFIAPWNPRTDGKVERSFGTLTPMFKKYSQGAGRHWPQFIPLFQLFMNSNMSRLTQSTPAALTFGRELRMPADVSHLQPIVPSPTERELQDWKEYQQRILNVVFPAIHSRVLSSKLKMTSQMDSRHKKQKPSPLLVPGTRVMTRAKSTTGKVKILGKIDSPYEGPYTIERKDRNGNFVLRDIGSGELLDRHVPPDQLKIHSAADEDIGEEDLYSVEKIVGKRTIDVPNDIGEGTHTETQYQVKWLDYPLDRRSEDSWVPVDQFVETDLIKKYEAKLQAQEDKSSSLGN